MTETESARSVVLERIRAALADGPTAVEIPRVYGTSLPVGTDVIERFHERVADYRANVHRVDDAQLPAAIARVPIAVLPPGECVTADAKPRRRDPSPADPRSLSCWRETALAS